MANEYVNKVVLSSGETLIDLSGDTVDAAHVLKGSTFHDKSGAPKTGTCTYDSDRRRIPLRRLKCWWVKPPTHAA